MTINDAQKSVLNTLIYSEYFVLINLYVRDLKKKSNLINFEWNH